MMPCSGARTVRDGVTGMAAAAFAEAGRRADGVM